MVPHVCCAMLLQIFDFLDQEGLGSFNLVALMNSVPEWLDDLDDEVRRAGGMAWGLQTGTAQSLQVQLQTMHAHLGC